jgi:hypothetical protein
VAAAATVCNGEAYDSNNSNLTINQTRDGAAWRINPKQQTTKWNSIESIESNNSNNQPYEGMERHGAATAHGHH